ncbi:MAG: hypothetical protein UFP03_02850 [Paludibacteraceae bacterium]|jgi:glutathione synthase/RimK-type ligase-like ATP-grasp enzyme|nr:hypothetical protein [Paludibacteraceae bacterium]
MKVQGLNDSQLFLLKMFSANQTTESFMELKDVLFQHYVYKAEEEAMALIKSGKVSKEKLKEASKKHFRTSY